MPSYDYEVIVVGAGLGGLTTAATLAANGARVLVLEQGDAPGGCCRTLEIEGYRFDIGPSAFTGFAPGEPFHELFRALNEEGKLKEKNFMRPLEPGLQALLPGHRVTLFPELARLLEELEREYPECIRLLERLYPALLGSREEKGNPMSRLAARLRLRWLGLRLRGRPEAREYISVLSHYISPCSGSMDVGTMLKVLHHLCNPFYLFAGGSSTLSQFLADTIRRNGGEVNCGARVGGLLRDGGRVMGVMATLQSVQGQITARAVVLNSILQSRDYGFLSTQEVAKASGKGPSGVFPFSLLLGVKEEALPEPLSPFAVALLSEICPQAAGSTVRLSLSPHWDRGWAPEGERTLKATLFLSGGEEQSHESSTFARLTQSLLEALTGDIPFLRKHITFMKALTPEDYQQLCGRKNGSLCPGRRGSSLYRKRKSRANPVPGLYLVGADSLGEFGALAAVQSGLSAGAALCAENR